MTGPPTPGAGGRRGGAGDPAVWLRTHRTVAMVGGAGAVAALALIRKRRPKAAAPATSANTPTSVAAMPVTADTVAADLASQMGDQFVTLEQQIAALGTQLQTSGNQGGASPDTSPTGAAPAPGASSALPKPTPVTPSPAYGVLPNYTPGGSVITAEPVAGVPIGSYDVESASNASGSFYRYQTGAATSPGTSVGGVTVPAGATPVMSGGTQIGWSAGGTTYPLHPVQYT